MSWVSVAVELAPAQAEAVADALVDLGAVSVDIADADAGTGQEMPVFDEPGAANALGWERCCVNVLFEQQADHRRMLRAACDRVGIAVPVNVQTRVVPDQDWVSATRRQFVPMQVSKRLWVVPSWAESPDPAAINLRLDPGLAFGTGSHATTRQCLLWLDDHMRPDWSVLDYGCGSGILAIAAKKLGAGRVVGVDIDPNAINASVGNATRNGVEVEFALPDGVGESAFDVVVANLLARPLRVLAPLLTARTRVGGSIVLAGILAGQVAAVRDAYADSAELAVVYPSEGWVCLSGARKR